MVLWKSGNQTDDDLRAIIDRGTVFDFISAVTNPSREIL